MIRIALVLALLASAAFAEDMPLEVYQSLKAKLAEYHAAKPGAQMALVLEVRSNEAAVFSAATSEKGIQRILAAACLGFAADKKRAVEALVKLLEDAESDVRQRACESLELQPDAFAVDALIKALADDKELKVRADAAAALGAIRDDRAIESLSSSLNRDESKHVRAFCAMALGRFANDHPEAVKALTDALDSEKDEMVKNTIANVLRKHLNPEGEKPEPDESAQKLSELAAQMKELEDKLRGDRHDDAVQADGKEIEDKLASMIADLEKQQNQQQQQKKEQKQKQASKQEKQKGSGGQNPLQGSSLPPEVAAGPMQPPATVQGKQSQWSKLPPAQRDELMQAFGADVPMRWRKRLEAYFFSIAVEEEKDNERNRRK
jgi:HEAT repeat protein